MDGRMRTVNVDEYVSASIIRECIYAGNQSIDEGLPLPFLILVGSGDSQ